MHLANLVDPAGVVEDALGGCGLPRIYVGNDAYISGFFPEETLWALSLPPQG